MYCEKCVALPEVDYLEAYRLQFFGKRRDGWSWLFGIGGLLNLVMATSGVVRTVLNGGSVDRLNVTFVSVMLVLAAVQLGWFFKQRWARVAMLAAFGLFALALVFLEGAPAVAGLVVPGAVVGTAFFSVRSRLFFELDVPREELKKDWSVYFDNRIARSSSALAVASLIFPLFAPAAVVTGVIGLRRVNPHSVPPVGNRNRALVGVILGGLTTAGWLVVAAIFASTR